MCVANGTSVTTPHLPIRAELINVSGNSPQSIFVGGRQFSIVGTFNPPSRISPLYSIGRAYTNIATPVFALRRKATHVGIGLRLQGYDLLLSSDAYMLVTMGATITGGVWGTPDNMIASETALETNTTFTAASGGVPIYGSLINRASMVESILQKVTISETDAMLFTITALSGQGNQSVTGMILRISEEW